jgi:hypothetical protein
LNLNPPAPARQRGDAAVMLRQHVVLEIPNPAANSAKVRFVHKNAMTSTAWDGGASRHGVPVAAWQRSSAAASMSHACPLTFTPARNKAYPAAVRTGVKSVPW